MRPRNAAIALFVSTPVIHGTYISHSQDLVVIVNLRQVLGTVIDSSALVCSIVLSLKDVPFRSLYLCYEYVC